MWNFSEIVRSEDRAKLSLMMKFSHSRSTAVAGGDWTIKYKLRRRQGKLTNLFSISAPDRLKPRREHRLDDVMETVKFAAFHDRNNTTGLIGFGTFKVRLREIVGVDLANQVATMFAERIKIEVKSGLKTVKS